jgi:hypothetical protein
VIKKAYPVVVVTVVDTEEHTTEINGPAGDAALTSARARSVDGSIHFKAQG